jgi:nucleotide-binding universal stress UspA family protein
MGWKAKKKVIVPVDFSDSSVSAIRTALDCAESPESVHVVHGILNLQQISPYGYWALDEVKTREQTATEHLAKLLEDNDIRGVKAVVLLGEPGSEIVKYANDQQADLIVIPSHGYSGLTRMVLGSTAERVIRHAHCAVYVLRRVDAD